MAAGKRWTPSRERDRVTAIPYENLLDEHDLQILRSRLLTSLESLPWKERCLLYTRKRRLLAKERQRIVDVVMPEAMSLLGFAPLQRYHILNYFVRECGHKTYLEIGVQNPDNNFNRIEAAHKDGVDPAGNCTFPGTSDEFFAQNTRTFDLIFIDGLHLAAQVIKDVENSLHALNEGGAVLLHDCNPSEELQQREDWDGKTLWTGSVWKAIAHFRMTRPDLSVCTVNADFGVAVISRGGQELFPRAPASDLTYTFLEQHRVELLNLISWRDFLARFGQPATSTHLNPRHTNISSGEPPCCANR